MPCTSRDLYADVLHCTGQINMPGTREHVYYIRREDIVTWPAKGNTSLATIVTMSTDFVLAADKTWKKLSLVPDANSFVCEQQGSWGSKTFNNSVTVVLPGIQEEAAGLCAELNNDDVVFLVPQRDGKYRLFGNEAFQCTINPKQESGAAAASDSAQTTLESSVTDETPAPFYTGEIAVEE